MIPLAKIVALLIGSLVLVPGCATSRKTLVPTVPTNGDASARQRFSAAMSEFRRDGHEQSAAELEAIARQYPDDPIAPYARLYAGMAAVDSGDFAAATRNLKALAAAEVTDEALRARGTLYLGIALAYQRRCTDALPLLTSEERAINTDAERGEWLASVAECTVESGHPGDALAYYDAYYDLARPAERAYITARLSAIVATLSPDVVSRAYAKLSRRDGPVAAVLGLRYAADLTARGEAATAELVVTDTAGARERMGMATFAGGDAGDPQRMGAVLPLSGRRGRVGDLVMRGLVLAAGTFAGSDGAASPLPPFSLSVRDAA
ncbi:MAG TPA: tetratricopeptide repeat protein, partial [Kofleriaceae bacterium]|nr:tetratricopeptide repeat protein [Kofleriaceae bacterium]